MQRRPDRVVGKPSVGGRRHVPLGGWFLHGLLILLLVTLPGCGGCLKWPTQSASPTEEDEDEKRRREEEQRRREQARMPLNLGELRIQPHDRQANLRTVKPGHWMTALQAARANHSDLLGEVRSHNVDSQGVALALDLTPYRLITTRPAALPKGQMRLLETLHRIPLGVTAESSHGMALERLLTARRGGREEARDRQPTTRMPSHEFYLVVLAETPDEYTYFRRLHTVAAPPPLFSDRPVMRHYRVVIPERTTGLPPLPSHPLAWTSIAFLVWDDFHPNLLSPPQQTALVDWLHWGGQLIISGPGSLDKLSGSFLEPYLPADRAATRELREADFDELNRFWSLARRETGEVQPLAVSETTPVVGIELQLREQGRGLEQTGGLVAERRVGLGRIAVTSFGLSDRRLLTWGSYDSFINGGLLRRPGRRFAVQSHGDVEWVWKDAPELTFDARLVSGLRYFSRDAADEIESVRDNPDSEFARDRRVWGTAMDPDSGVAAWTDFSSATNAARQSLQEAAGISIPESSFVLQVVLVYLLVLTPLNWGFFRLMGRVEWAWFAAPLIAILASLVVIRLAQLDIGFVRSQTEVATLEIQTGYPRAHLTRHTALYSSLATRYDVTNEDPNALVQPMSTGLTYQQGPYEPSQVLTLHRDRRMRLSGLSMISNATGLLRSEQMLELGGTWEIRGDDQQGWELSNQSELAVRDGGVLYRAEDGGIEFAWLGDIAPQSRQRLAFHPAGEDDNLLESWRQAAVFSRGRLESGVLSLDFLLELAGRRWPLGPGEMRLIGWSDEDWPGQSITPQATQKRTASLILVHLRAPAWTEPQRDQNLYLDVADPSRLDRELFYNEFWDDEDLDELFP
jgi:hypothetical protein